MGGEVSWTQRWRVVGGRAALLLGSGLLLGAFGYRLARSFFVRRHDSNVDEGFAEASRVEEEPRERKILVLGPSGSGKSTLVTSLAESESSAPPEVASESLLPPWNPTEGFHVVRMNLGGGPSLDIWDLGGGAGVQPYWSRFLQDVDLLVFVVDGSDATELAAASKQFRLLMAEERLEGVPLLMVASKQDRPSAPRPTELADAMGLQEVAKAKGKQKRSVNVIGTSLVGPARTQSLGEFRKVLVHASSSPAEPNLK